MLHLYIYFVHLSGIYINLIFLKFQIIEERRDFLFSYIMLYSTLIKEINYIEKQIYSISFSYYYIYLLIDFYIDRSIDDDSNNNNN